MSNDKNKDWQNVTFSILGRKLTGIKGVRLKLTKEEFEWCKKGNPNFPKAWKRLPRKEKKKLTKAISAMFKKRPLN